MNTPIMTLFAAIAVAAAVFVRRPRSARQRLWSPPKSPKERTATRPETWRLSSLALGVAIAAALAVLRVALPLAAISGLVPAGIAWVRRRRAAALLRTACEAAVVEVTFALAGELRAGRTAREALNAAAGAAGPLADAIAAAAASVEVGGSAAAELGEAARIPGAARLRSVAAAWAVTESAGGRVALVLERLGEAMDSDDELRREMQAAMAAPRATMVMLAGLPLIGLGMGQALGARPFHLLLFRPLGWALLAGAAILDGTGVVVSRVITRWALR
ncbi:MAG TPA: type II secretion system F family protein [Mycobacteriales bacterium]|nr:type II secretion system F family protein [Mycobacteriales bacterium]